MTPVTGDCATLRSGFPLGLSWLSLHLEEHFSPGDIAYLSVFVDTLESLGCFLLHPVRLQGTQTVAFKDLRLVLQLKVLPLSQAALG